MYIGRLIGQNNINDPGSRLSLNRNVLVNKYKTRIGLSNC